MSGGAHVGSELIAFRREEEPSAPGVKLGIACDEDVEIVWRDLQSGGMPLVHGLTKGGELGEHGMVLFVRWLLRCAPEPVAR